MLQYIDFTFQGNPYRAMVDGAEVLKCEALDARGWSRTSSANVHRAAAEAVTAQREKAREHT